MNVKTSEAAGSHAPNLGREHDHMLGGGASEQTRQPRTRPDATADDGNSRTPRTSAGAVEGAPKHAPISGSFAETITEIVKSARQKRQLCEEQELELRRCLPVLLSSTSSPLEQGHALLRVIENQLMPAWESGVENSWKLFKLSQLDVREFVELARLDRHQNGRRPALTAGELCASVSSTDTALPAQSTSPSVELAQPDTTVPPVALADANKHPAPLDTALTATDAELNLAAWVNKAPVRAMATAIEAPAPRSAERLPYLEAVIGKGFTYVFEMGAALEEIRDHELFHPQFKTFAEYFDLKWGWTRARCYQLIGAAQVRRNLSTRVDIAHLSEPLCRVLSKLPAGDQVAAWNEAAAAAPEGKMTLTHLKMAVAKFSPALPAPSSAPVESRPLTEFKGRRVIVAPDKAQSAQSPEPAPDTTPAPSGFGEFDLEIEWPPVESLLYNLFQGCAPGKRSDLWSKLEGFFARYPEFIPEAKS